MKYVVSQLIKIITVFTVSFPYGGFVPFPVKVYDLFITRERFSMICTIPRHASYPFSCESLSKYMYRFRVEFSQILSKKILVYKKFT